MSRQILEIVRGEIFPIDKFLPLINFQPRMTYSTSEENYLFHVCTTFSFIFI